MFDIDICCDTGLAWHYSSYPVVTLSLFVYGNVKI